VLTDTSLEHFDPKSGQSKGKLLFAAGGFAAEGCSVREEAEPAHSFTVACGGEEHLLLAASAAERAEWVADIRWRMERPQREVEDATARHAAYKRLQVENFRLQKRLEVYVAGAAARAEAVRAATRAEAAEAARAEAARAATRAEAARAEAARAEAARAEAARAVDVRTQTQKNIASAAAVTVAAVRAAAAVVKGVNTPKRGGRQRTLRKSRKTKKGSRRKGSRKKKGSRRKGE
jgi:hypothetical protein